jgi:hypothetical protein
LTFGDEKNTTLEVLSLKGVKGLETLDVSNCEALKVLSITNSSISNLIMNRNLEKLYASYTKNLKTLVMDDESKLQILELKSSDIENIKFGYYLTHLRFDNTKNLKEIDISHCGYLKCLTLFNSNIQKIYCHPNINQIKKSKNSKVEINYSTSFISSNGVRTFDNYQFEKCNFLILKKIIFKTLDISRCVNLEKVTIYNSNVSNIIVNKTLKYLSCTNLKNLQILNVSDLNNLEYLYLNNVKLEKLYLSPSLKDLVCNNIQNVNVFNFNECINLTRLDISYSTISIDNLKLDNLKSLICRGRNISLLNLLNFKNLEYVCVCNSTIDKFIANFNLKIIKLKNTNIDHLDLHNINLIERLSILSCRIGKFYINCSLSKIENDNDYVDNNEAKDLENEENEENNFVNNKKCLEQELSYKTILKQNKPIMEFQYKEIKKILKELSNTEYENNENEKYKIEFNYQFLKLVDLSFSTFANVYLDKNDSINKYTLERLSFSNCKQLTSLYLRGMIIKKLELNKNLRNLNCYGIKKLQTLDLSNSPLIEFVDISFTHIKFFTPSIGLKFLMSKSNYIEKLNVSNCSQLKYLNVRKTNLTTLLLNTNIEFLNFSFTPINNLNLTGCNNLETLIINGVKLNAIIFGTNLQQIMCNASTFNEGINLSKCLKLNRFNADWSTFNGGLYLNKNIKNLNLRHSKLTNLDLSNILLKQLDLSFCTMGLKLPYTLETLDISSSEIEELDVSMCNMLTFLDISFSHLKKLILNTNIVTLHASDTKNISTLDLSKCGLLRIVNLNQSNIEKLKIPETLSKLELNNTLKLNYLDTYNTKLRHLSLNGSGIKYLKTNASLNKLYLENVHYLQKAIISHSNLVSFHFSSSNKFFPDVNFLRLKHFYTPEISLTREPRISMVKFNNNIRKLTLKGNIKSLTLSNTNIELKLGRLLKFGYIEKICLINSSLYIINPDSKVIIKLIIKDSKSSIIFNKTDTLEILDIQK